LEGGVKKKEKRRGPHVKRKTVSGRTLHQPLLPKSERRLSRRKERGKIGAQKFKGGGKETTFCWGEEELSREGGK